MIGLHFQQASVGIREKFANLPGSDFLASMAAIPGVDEFACLNTCNRVELYFCGEAPHDRVAQVWAEKADADAGLLAQNTRYLAGTDVAVHLAEVCAGLDSMVLGEPQIFGQVKDTYQEAMEAGTLGPTLRYVFEKTFAVAKRIRTETGVGRYATNVSYLAVKVADQIFDTLSERSVLVLGAGEMAELALRHFKERNVAKMAIWNRTYSRALALAQEFGVEAVASENMLRAVAAADIVLVSTGAPEPVLRKEHVVNAQKERRNRPMAILDISVPRNVEPVVRDLSNVYLYDLDQLQSAVEQNEQERAIAATAGRKLATEAASRIWEDLDERRNGPRIGAIYAHWQTLATAEIERSARSGSWSGEMIAQVETMMRAHLRKVLHGLQEKVRTGQIDAEHARLIVSALLDEPVVHTNNGRATAATEKANDE